jgi:hypothetical protein
MVAVRCQRLQRSRSKASPLMETRPMILRITKCLRFWVECEYHRRHKEMPGQTRSQLTARFLREFEQGGRRYAVLGR